MSAAEETAAIARAHPVWGNGALAYRVLAGVFLAGLALLAWGLVGAEAGLDWGMLTVTWLYLMGISQAAIVFVAIMRLVGAQWSKPYHRLAELATLAFAPFAFALFLVICFGGRTVLFHWLHPHEGAHLSPWLDMGWLVARNLFGLLLFYGVSIVYVRKSLRADLPGAEPLDPRGLESELRAMSPWVIVAFVICNTLIAWDFGMMIAEHWYSTVFPIYFSFGHLYAATAALVLLIPLFGGTAGRSPFRPVQVRNLAMVVTGFTLIWLYLYWAQFFVIWYGNLPRETDVVWRQMYGHYAPWYWTMMTACFFVPFVAFIFAAVKRSLIAVCVLALGINAGIWINKYLTVVPVLAPDHRPLEHWLDIGIGLGLLAGFLAVLAWLVGRLPPFARWEMATEPGRERD